MKAANLGDNPILDARDPDLPVGLKVWAMLLSTLKTIDLPAYYCRTSALLVMLMPLSKFIVFLLLALLRADVLGLPRCGFGILHFEVVCTIVNPHKKNSRWHTCIRITYVQDLMQPNRNHQSFSSK
jgi:hypothetical protein